MKNNNGNNNMKNNKNKNNYNENKNNKCIRTISQASPRLTCNKLPSKYPSPAVFGSLTRRNALHKQNTRASTFCVLFSPYTFLVIINFQGASRLTNDLALPVQDILFSSEHLTHTETCFSACSTGRLDAFNDRINILSHIVHLMTSTRL